MINFYVLFLTIVSGLKAYITANPALTCESSTTLVDTKTSDVSGSISEFEDAEVAEEFYDAIADDSSSSSDDEEEDGDAQLDNKVFTFFHFSKLMIRMVIIKKTLYERDRNCSFNFNRVRE